MASIDDLKTEVESYVADVNADTKTLGDKIAALTAASNANADPAKIDALLQEVKDAHAALASTVAAAPAATGSGSSSSGSSSGSSSSGSSSTP
jgi:ribosomal protein L12E/L44/L45/RPP1/RPP2